MKNQKGITLIALVITIVVMLILVGVTISVSLNGGLFSTAKQATKETQIAQEKEELLIAALGTLNKNGEVNLSKLDSSLPEGFTGSNGQYTSKTGNVFTVTKDGAITLAGESSGEQPETPTVCVHTNTKTEGAIVATCTTAGYTGNTVCSDCGEIISNGSTIDALGHTTTNGTCGNCGELIENINHSGTIPEGGTYTHYVNPEIIFDEENYTITFQYDSVETYSGGEEFPELAMGDIYTYGDYEYCHGYSFCGPESCAEWTNTCGCGPSTCDGWSVMYTSANLSPGKILTTINGANVTDMYCTFYYSGITTAPAIPSTVTCLACTFYECNSLTIAPEIPSTVTDMSNTFHGCESLTTAPDLSQCTQLKYMDQTFFCCSSLTNLANFVIPSNVTNMSLTFAICSSLTGTIKINTNNITTSNDAYMEGSCEQCFEGVDMTNITLNGDAPIDILNLIGSTGDNWTTLQ